MPKISVILPSYNGEEYIRKCIDSILNQSLKELELICIDDLSSDSTRDILNSYAEKDSRVKLIFNEKNSGTLITRKRGVLAAEGEYIMFADNDDWYEPEACEELYALAKAKAADLVLYGIRKVALVGTGAQQNVEARGTELPIEEEFRGEHCIGVKNRMNWLWNKLVRAEVCRQAYEAAEDIYLTVAEDTYACWLIHYFARSLVTTQRVYYNWNNTSGVSNVNMSVEAFDRFCRCMSDYERAMLSFFEREQAPESVVDFYVNGDKEPRSSYCVNKWRKSLAEEDAAEGMRILLKYYAQDTIARDIHYRWNKMEAARQEKIAALKEEKKKIKSSAAYRAGRALTAIPRALKKENDR